MELEWPASEMVRKSTVFRSCGDIVEMRAPGQEEPKRWTSYMGTGYGLIKSPRVGFGRTISLEHPANLVLVGGMADGRRVGRDQTVCYQRLLMIADKNSKYRRLGIDGVHDARELEESQDSGNERRGQRYTICRFKLIQEDQKQSCPVFILYFLKYSSGSLDECYPLGCFSSALLFLCLFVLPSVVLDYSGMLYSQT